MRLALYVVACVLLWLASGVSAGLLMGLYLRRKWPTAYGPFDPYFWWIVATEQVHLGPFALSRTVYRCWARPCLVESLFRFGRTRYGLPLKPAYWWLKGRG